MTLPGPAAPTGRATLLQLLAFGAAGGTAFAVEVALFAGVYWLLPQVAVANAAAVLVGSAVSYLLQARLVFRTTASMRRTVLRYALALVVVYVLSTALVALLVGRDVVPTVAKVAVSLFLAPFAFLASRHWVYAA